MAHKHNSIWPVLSLTVIVSLTLSLVAPIPASASPSPQSGGDGLQRNRNAETGKVTLISPSGNGPMAATEALGVTSLSQATNGDTALALAERFAPEFGLQSASENLKQLKVTEAEGGRKAVHYQQTYQGVPVFAGELIVNTDDRGDLYSINGEVSQNLSLSTAPKITSKQAQDTALAATAKWYQKQVSDLTVTDATLMIYDAKLLSPSDRAPELVWKMEVTPLDASEPINELVLVNAQDGKVSLHFNQIDTAFSAKAAGQDPDPTTPTPTDTPPSQPPTASPSTGTPTPAPNDVHPSQPSTDAPSFDNLTPTPMLDVQSQGSEVGILTSDTRYVSTTGADTGDCKTSSSPCLTIQYALNQDSDGSDIIRVAAGTYIRGVGNAINTDPNVVIISRSDTLSGGWNSDFTSQIGYSTIDGEYNVAGDHKNNNGVLVKSSPVVVDRFVIQNSTSWNGGGIYLLAGLTLMNSTVNNNHSGSNGAGIFIDSGGSLTLINSTLSGNIASLGGGGLFNAGSGAVTIQNSTLAYNNGTSSGGGIHPGSGSTVIRNTILAHNTASAGPDCSGTIG
ncbi:MAG TPA: hypothetical protein VHM28_12095, partial [Anaerolineales bacterium]|nr:hypothetical protein [Anaerolineales bacterium]